MSLEISLVDGEWMGAVQGEDGEPRWLRRKGRVKWEELLRDVPEAHREATNAVGKAAYPKGLVQRQVAKSWSYIADVYLGCVSSGVSPPLGLARLLWEDGVLLAPERFWPSLLGLALEEDGRRLGELQRGQCGNSTWERITDDGGHSFFVYRCRGSRCRHCSKVSGLKKRKPIAESLLVHEAEGRMGSFVTTTFDPVREMERYGVSRVAARALAWRVGTTYRKVWVRNLRRNGIDVRYVCRTEPHLSGWPHFHFLVVSSELGRRALEEAGCETVSELVERTRAESERWKAEVEGWKAAGSQGRPPVHRCQTPRLRQWLKERAVSAGFGGGMFWFEPVRDAAEVAAYVTKDTFSVPDVVGEVTKSRHQTAVVIPRGSRMWNASQRGNAFYIKAHEGEADKDKDEEPPRTVTLTRHYAPIGLVRELAVGLDEQPGHEVHGVDMRGEPPGKGGRWPMTLQGFMVEEPVWEGLLPFRGEVGGEGPQEPEEPARGGLDPPPLDAARGPP